MYLKITRRMELSYTCIFLPALLFQNENKKQKYCLNQLCIMQFVIKKKSVTPIEQSFVYLHVLYLSDIHVHVLTPSWKHLLFLEHGLWESRAWTFQWETVTIKWYEVRHRSKVIVMTFTSIQFNTLNNH